MYIIPKILIGIVAVEHLYILWIEMFAWTTKGKKTFKSLSPDLFEPTKTLAANQGLYNGFLAAGLFWSLLIRDAVWAKNISLFFLTCIIVAAVYGGITTSRSILVKQGLPAAVALCSLLFL